MRALLLIALALVVACGGEVERSSTCEDVMQKLAQGSGITPWHTWGNVQTGRIDRSATMTAELPQLVSVNYKRPEQWKLLLGAQVGQQNAANLPTLTVFFDVTVGVGRASMMLPSFATITWTAAELQAGSTKFATTFQQPIENAARTDTNIVEHLPAETLYVKARIVGSIPNGFCEVTAFGMVCPNTHVRPEWSVQRFYGGEL